MLLHARTAPVVIGITALLVLFGATPAFAQEGHTTAEQRLAAINQEEAIAVMRAAILHAEAELAIDGQPSGRHDSTLDQGTKLAASVLLPSNSSPPPASVKAFAERLADALMAELVMQEEDLGVYMTAHLPEIDGSKAGVHVSRTTVSAAWFSTRTWDLELERSPDESWQVTEVSHGIIACGIPASGEKPELIGGEAALYEALEYPDAARSANIEGTVFIQFVVDPDGQARDFEVLRSPHEQFSKEAERVLREEVRFTPGRDAQGEAVAARTSLAIRFKR